MGIPMKRDGPQQLREKFYRDQLRQLLKLQGDLRRRGVLLDRTCRVREGAAGAEGAEEGAEGAAQTGSDSSIGGGTAPPSPRAASPRAASPRAEHLSSGAPSPCPESLT